MTTKVNITTDAGANVSQVSEAIALRIKAYRKKKKLSLDELSRRAGISKGMLVEIEKGAANPSIAILCKLSAALGVSVADMVDVASDPLVHVIAAENMPILWQGERGGKAQLLAGTSGPDMIELWRWSLLPGEIFTSAGHPVGTSELFYVEQGTLTLTVAENSVMIEAGAAAIARTDVPHSYANEQETPLIFTMTVAELHT
ncbi:helix-turn-helix domain-containing protein [Erwinia sp. PK3-005]|uniref:Helix-turn-helix domain-containing protein n=1 Tax=Mixta hanseatica TaxID=2872648 RepID=A0ABY4R8A5_9GAMM|nr:helix-turn-helix domain-containing protein [Mixta hanseatica]UQY42970.1 helix-turn-helix domain-containing protein [Mixta hanseatica]